MQPEKQSPLTFIVRMWREKSGDQYVWRGSVDHVQSGKRAYFQAVSLLVEIITRAMENRFGEKDIPDGRPPPEESVEVNKS